MQVDSWMGPKLLEATPNHIRDWVNERARYGHVDASHIVLFHLFKTFTPGGVDEIAQLQQKILNPQVCSNAKSAQVELIRWKETIKRMMELNIAPPDIHLTYAAMESIFSTVFEKAD